MESNDALKAKTLALAIAIGIGGAATTVRADELQDLRAQIEALQKKVGELELKHETAEKSLLIALSLAGALFPLEVPAQFSVGSTAGAGSA
jgi:hypothetical protein